MTYHLPLQLAYRACSALVDFSNRFAWTQQICAGYDYSLARSQSVENQYLAAGQWAGPDCERLGDRSALLLLSCVDEVTIADRIVYQSVDGDFQRGMEAFGLCGLNGGNHPRPQLETRICNRHFDLERPHPWVRRRCQRQNSAVKGFARKSVHGQVERLPLAETAQRRIRHIESTLDESQIRQGERRSSCGDQSAQLDAPLQQYASKRRPQDRVAKSNLRLADLRGSGIHALTRPHARRLRRIDLGPRNIEPRLAPIVDRLGNTFLFPKFRDAVEIQFRLREAGLRLCDLRLGCADPGFSFISDSARLVDDCLKLTGPNASERRAGGHWSSRFQRPDPAIGPFRLRELHNIAGNPKREINLGVRRYDRRIPRGGRVLRQFDDSHANCFRRRIAIILGGALMSSASGGQ